MPNPDARSRLHTLKLAKASLLQIARDSTEDGRSTDAETINHFLPTLSAMIDRASPVAPTDQNATTGGPRPKRPKITPPPLPVPEKRK